MVYLGFVRTDDRCDAYLVSASLFTYSVVIQNVTYMMSVVL